jgi:hypothetical protein
VPEEQPILNGILARISESQIKGVVVPGTPVPAMKKTTILKDAARH